MASLKDVMDAIVTFCNAVNSAGALEEFVFRFKPAAIVSDEAHLTMNKALQVLLSSLNSQAEAMPVCPAGDNISEQKEEEDEVPVPNMNEAETSIATSSGTAPVTEEDLVQIAVNRTEVNRRISSFLCLKRKEVDESNAKEFCNNHLLDYNHLPHEEINSCARVDAVFVPRSGYKSHVKVSRVDNLWGPQTTQPSSTNATVKRESTDCPAGPMPEDIEERLRNMEFQLRIKSERSYMKSLYTRLKQLEDRILFLEGLSPDYFRPRGLIFQSPQKKSRSEKTKILFNCSIDELQRRKQELKGELKFKATVRTETLFR